jgi:hypothetical protein
LLGANNVYRVETGCGYVDGAWGTNGGVIGLRDDGRLIGECSTELAEFDQLLAETLSGRVEAEAEGEDDGTRLVVRSLRATLTLVRDPEGPSSLPPLPVSSVSPVRMGGGEPAGQVIGPVMIARQCDPDCAREEALITGTLALIGECLYIDDPESGALTALWPFGTQWQPDPPAVVLPGGATIAVGDQFDGGGGYHTVADLGAFTDQQEVLDKASACTLDETAELAVIQTS